MLLQPGRHFPAGLLFSGLVRVRRSQPALIVPRGAILLDFARRIKLYYSFYFLQYIVMYLDLSVLHSVLGFLAMGVLLLSICSIWDGFSEQYPMLCL